MSDKTKLVAVVVTAFEAVGNAQRVLQDVIERDYPPGAKVRWRRGGRLHEGTVRQLNYGSTLFAINDRTGRDVKVQVYEIVDAALIEVDAGQPLS